MKRLVLLTLILVPSAFHAVGNMSSACRPTVAIGPRSGRIQTVSDGPVETPSGEYTRIIRHLPAATPERAREDAWQALTATVVRWLGSSGVPESWTPPDAILRSMVREQPIEVVEKDYGTIYIQPLAFDADPRNHDLLLESYERELAGKRLVGLGGVLVFVLSCLAAVTGYIRADEATRGYYTNTLRAGAVAAVATIGVVLYRLLG